jgi:Flp pilus assembly protein TadD
MSSPLRPLLAVAAAVLLSACGAAPPATSRDLAALDGVTSAIMSSPLTTSSVEARNHYLQGLRELDLVRPFDALEHFKLAVAADSNFAIAYLAVANTGNSLAEFKTNLARAEQLAARASEAEQLQIQIARKGFENDISDQLAAAQQLVDKNPLSARAYDALAGIQSALNRNVEARASLEKALQLAPRFLLAHTDLGNSYLLSEPKDFQKALQHFQAAEALAPNEPALHDFLGDAQRALNDLPAARAEYTRGHELNPRDAGLLQQRGHVNSFAGDYAAARADYDSALALGRGNERGFFAPFRAYVSAYAGDPAAAIAELNKLVIDVDGMGIPEPRGTKINALTNVALIAIHTRDFYAADAALKARTPLMMQQADQVGSPGFRRAQQANVAYFESWLAARRGDYSGAQIAANRMAALVAPDANPRKLEPFHQLQGFIALYQGNSKDAAAHFAQGNLQDPYIQYNYALALEGSGEAAKAKQIFQALAIYNFNSLGYALIRKEAQQKAAAS